MFSVCMSARYKASPKDSHFKIVKVILRHLNGTSIAYDSEMKSPCVFGQNLIQGKISKSF